MHTFLNPKNCGPTNELPWQYKPTNDLDLAGWELRKALRLFRKSNPPMLEWLDSPIVYRKEFTTAERLRKLKKRYFNPRSCLHGAPGPAGTTRDFAKTDRKPAFVTV